MAVSSFRVKIVVTIIVVISLFSVISFTLFNLSLKEKILNQTAERYNEYNELQNKFYISSFNQNKNFIENNLKNTLDRKSLIESFLLDSNTRNVFPKDYASLGGDTIGIDKLLNQTNDVMIRTFSKKLIPFHRVFFRIQNEPTCKTCHGAMKNNLGMVVMNMSNKESREIISFSQKFSFIYTFLTLLIIFLLVAYLHYKYIRKSLLQFKETIAVVNKGNLDSRLSIPRVRELGSLGQDFNIMLDNIEKTQNELNDYHKKELENSQKLATIGEMSARIAHEIRNPITGIERALELIVKEMKDTDNKHILEEVQKQANRVNQAISNLLKFSHTKEVKHVKGNINDLIESVLINLRNNVKDKNITYYTQLAEMLPPILFDKDLMENVLLNLSYNAIQAIDEVGNITYTTTIDESKTNLIISLKDNGRGISAKAGTEIFKPFYTTRTQGTGLGLAISKEIIENHNGKLWYENNIDAGCTFFISLPLNLNN